MAVKGLIFKRVEVIVGIGLKARCATAKKKEYAKKSETDVFHSIPPPQYKWHLERSKGSLMNLDVTLILGMDGLRGFG
jgi:hypothetical protein